MADMRGRRPDGVATEGEKKSEAQPPLMGQAANEAQDRVEARGTPPFPSGLAALEGRDPHDRVVLINMQLGGGRYTVVDWDKPEKKGGGRPTKTIAAGPLQAFAVHVQDAVRLLRLFGPDAELATPRGRPRPKVKLLVAPPKGDCGGKMSFHAPHLGAVAPDGSASGLDIPTCPFANCPHHPSDLPWSIWQAQNLIMRTKSPGAIEDFINGWDPRRDVLFFGTQMAALRRRRKLERMGVASSSGGRVY